jgi:hypothetical protein
MKISQFIADEVLRPRLLGRGCLVLYDPARRYHEVCLGMAGERVRVVDAGEGSLPGRRAMQQALGEMGQPGAALDGLLVYVPAPVPLDDVALQASPYAAAHVCGAVFPEGPADDYEQLCLRARPDHQTEIRRLFAQTPEGPGFAVIDALGGGFGWPQLKAVLGEESAREILRALLAPDEGQARALKAQEAWVPEAREFLKSTLGLTLKTRGKTWSAIADETWRFVLFSEFAFDLPVTMPEALQAMPRAPAEARTIVEDTCERLRADARAKATYIDRAGQVQAELNLVLLCRELPELGVRETFQFEERSVLRAASLALTRGDWDDARAKVAQHQHSVWRGQEDSQAQWQLLESALALAQRCDDLGRGLAEHLRSLTALLDHYVTSLREVDRLHREFEQAVSADFDLADGLAAAVAHVRGQYRSVVEKVQTALLRHLENGAWPPAGRLTNAEVFDRFVAAPLAEQGRRVVFFMVDALRYELGVTLERRLAKDMPVTLHAACAALPTITPVGMASLLPGAAQGSRLASQADGTVLPRLHGAPVATVQQRMDVLRNAYGDRFAEYRLEDLTRWIQSIPVTVDLLVLRSVEIDAQLETGSENALMLVPRTLNQIGAALHKLRRHGFTDAVIAADHGFFLNALAGSGDVCRKPQGNWPVYAHDRMALGAGAADSSNLVLGAERLGMRAEGFTQVALPRSLAPYRAGYFYFHGGLSLQEAVVPVLVARLQQAHEQEGAQARITLGYKGGASKKITTLVPVFDVSLVAVGLFSQGQPVEVLLEAHNRQGDVVGEARPGGDVNPATRTVTLQAGESKKIVLRMSPEAQGKVKVHALNPTTLEKLASLDLEVEFTV